MVWWCGGGGGGGGGGVCVWGRGGRGVGWCVVCGVGVGVGVCGCVCGCVCLCVEGGLSRFRHRDPEAAELHLVNGSGCVPRHLHTAYHVPCGRPHQTNSHFRHARAAHQLLIQVSGQIAVPFLTRQRNVVSSPDDVLGNSFSRRTPNHLHSFFPKPWNWHIHHLSNSALSDALLRDHSQLRCHVGHLLCSVTCARVTFTVRP